MEGRAGQPGEKLPVLRSYLDNTHLADRLWQENHG